jgi:pyruvate/2-oxoglutarate dehydrogenase complex dihydrolipoamide dehydrogenase (E3) component
VDVRTGAKAKAVRAENGAVTIELDDGESVSGGEILVAIGRTARTSGIGLESLGIEVERWLGVDDQLRVDGSDWLYAIGDVNGRALFTHMGKYQGRIAADQILGKEVAATAGERALPRVTFTDPEVAAVGPTLAEAKEAGIDARAVDVETSATAGASFKGRNAPGTTRIIVDENRRVIVGATFIGAETADFLHAATVAVVGEVPLDELWHAVPAYPTRSEVWLKLMEEYGL